MALQITNNAGIIEISGKLNAQNAISLQNYFESLIMHSSFIIVSLNNVSELDKSSFNTLINFKSSRLCIRF